MRPRGVLALLAIVVAATGVAAFGFPWNGPSDRWRRAPAVTIVSRAGDPRIAATEEAVAFWNHTLAEMGTPFRLGPVDRVEGEIADRDLRALSAVVGGEWAFDTWLRGLWLRRHPRPFDRFQGDLLVVLSDGKFISFSSPIGDRRLVGIKDAALWPLTVPNVLRNVIAHEIGHAIGLRHSADPTTLMCGRPASCRPGIYASDTPHFFPLTEADRERLRSLYPASTTR